MASTTKPTAPVPAYYASGWNPYEINSRKGLPYGGVPTSMLLAKMEESPAAPGDDPAAEYDAYARGQLVDWGTTEPVLGDRGYARGMGVHRLNYQYYGTHGSSSTVPQHPDLFVDFTDSDVPGDRIRFDEARRQGTTRINVLAAAFGQNDDNTVGESEYTQVAQSYDRKTMQRWVAERRKIYSSQMQGRDALGQATPVTSTMMTARDAAIGGQGVIGWGAGARDAASITRAAGVGAETAGAMGATARAGKTDAFFGGGSSGRTRGSERVAGVGVRDGFAAARAGSLDSELGAGHTAQGRRRLERLARATAAGRPGGGSRTGHAAGRSAEGIITGAGAGAGRPDPLGQRNAMWAPDVSIVSGGVANDTRIRNIARGLRAQSAPKARRAMDRSAVDTYRAAAADLATPFSGKAPGKMPPQMDAGRTTTRRDGATLWTADAPGQRAATSAKREALPVGGYSAGKLASTRTAMVAPRPEGVAIAAGSASGGSAYGVTGRGGPVGRGAVASVEPDDLDFGA